MSASGFSAGNDSPRPAKRLRVDPCESIQTSSIASKLELPFEHYTVGWVCALYLEKAAALAMLDRVHRDMQVGAEGDSNVYTLGQTGDHNVVITYLPTGSYGTNVAATVGSNMCRTFRSLRMRLLVGLGGGVLGEGNVWLGDVVIGHEVIQYDLGKETGDGSFHVTGSKTRPTFEHLTAVESLRAAHELSPTRILFILTEMLRKHPSMT
jgi:nucleoside phosphorylase